MTFERARAVADAVLYEGYALYPYRASSAKNRVRWQFGVLAPRAWSENGGCEPWSLQCECLLEPDDGARLHGMLRCLQIQRRTIEEATGEPDADGAPGFRPVPSLQIDDRLLVTWEEGVEREVPFELALASLPGGTACPAPVGTPQLRTIDFAFPARREVETLVDAAGRTRGRVVREQAAIGGVVRVDATRLRLPYALTKVRVRVENLTTCTLDAAPREEILASSLVGAHVLLAVDPGTFLSLVDPPEWAHDAVASCAHSGAWPVLLGDPAHPDTVLCSAIILPDHPEVAPESPGDLFDATEIDEILTLRTLTLTDDEKREARATDGRVAAILDRVDAMPPEILGRLHGAIRGLRAAPDPGAASDPRQGIAADAPPPWWDPGADASVSPETDAIDVAGIAVAKGSLVRLRPAGRGADAQDMFLDGRVARVAAVFSDVEARGYLAVTIDDDPGAELQQWHGRFLYFGPEEVEPIDGAASGGAR